MTTYADREFDSEIHARLLERVDEAIPTRMRDQRSLPAEIEMWARALVAGDAENLLVFGPTGTGKTTTCWQALRRAVESGFRGKWRWWPAGDLAAALRPNDNLDETVRAAREVDLLILDDLGASALTDWQREQLHRIVNARWEWRRPIAMSTNVRKLGEVVGDRIASRLQEGAVIVAINGADRRRK